MLTPLVTEGQVLLGACCASVVGLIGLAAWRLRRSENVPAGLAWLLLALVWPLWELFQALDRWLDMVTVRGVAAAYAVFALLGLCLGVIGGIVSRRRIAGSAAAASDENVTEEQEANG